jgi:hypothetical protein
LHFFPLSAHQSTYQDNSSLTTTANHSLTPSFSVYFHEQRKGTLRSGITFWKPRPSALSTSQWQSRLNSSYLYKKKHLTCEMQFIQEGVTDNAHQERTHQCRRPDRRPTALPRNHVDRASCSSTSRRLINTTADLRPTDRVASGSSSLAADRRSRHYMATQLYFAVNSRR